MRSYKFMIPFNNIFLLHREGIDRTMFTKWMQMNSVNEEARSLTYAEFPTKFVWSKQQKQWRPRKSGKTIGRITYAPPTSGERYYLRMLLNTVKGPQNFEQIRTIDNVMHPTFKSACYALGLLDGDKEWNDAIKGAEQWATAAQLRQLFITLLLFCEVSNPLQLWTNNWQALSDDILH